MDWKAVGKKATKALLGIAGFVLICFGVVDVGNRMVDSAQADLARPEVSATTVL